MLGLLSARPGLEPGEYKLIMVFLHYSLKGDLIGGKYEISNIANNQKLFNSFKTVCVE